MIRKSSKVLLNRIKALEGLKLEAYKCPAGVWSIGYGHTQGVKPGQKISADQAVKFLLQDLSVYETFVNGLQVARTQEQFDALVDFCYNVGCNALAGSTLLQKIRAKAPLPEIQAQFMAWNKATVTVTDPKTGEKKKVKKELKGLTSRRRWEADRYAQNYDL